MPRFVQSLTLKVSDKEFHVVLSELEQSFGNKLGGIESQVSTAEQSIWPMLAGLDVDSDQRLANKHLIIGSKQDISQLFFATLLEQAIKRYIPEVTCEIRYPNGGSLKNFADVKYRWVDVYIDFTGTCSQYFNIQHHEKSDEEIIGELNRYGDPIGLKWLSPLGASEDYCLVMASKTAQDKGVASIRDLKLAGPGLVFSADPEFLNRNDCYLGMKKYGISFKSVKLCDIAERYQLLASGEADVFVGYETDPQLYHGDVIRLADPDEFFPRYLALPLVNTEALNKIPGLEKALQSLHGIIKTEDLVAVVNRLGEANSHPSVARDLARQYLDKLAG